MFSHSEKAYCQALLALRNKDYVSAVSHFDRSAAQFSNDPEFSLLSEATRLLVAVKRELGTVEADELLIEEVFSDGQEADLSG